ncbi:VOC family protein [Roseicyclus persicicus]|uniref:VOC family protein n=1 Tax=Roseicyclus persicicus TaxID=2650661 RepID=A0A7X6H2G2_9RHOB|nr:VOC family protein [Roseibacterium persicicum]NKX45547.1 VOC family protein [Roseibacterium persicicum]
MTTPARVRTCIWIDRDVAGAARTYTALLPGSRILDMRAFEHMLTNEPEGVRVIEIELAGTPYTLLEAGPHHPPTDRMSIAVATEDQAETDRLWHALTADGGQEMACGWLRDRWGVAWQIVPRRVTEMAASGDRAKVSALLRAMQPMRRLDLAALEAAWAAG